MVIIETCPICGHDLRNEVLTVYPPIPRKFCPSCGWSWEGKREEVIRVPFTDSVDTKQSACDNCSCNSKNGGSGICLCTLGTDKITY